jgi:hypothetical protein
MRALQTYDESKGFVSFRAVIRIKLEMRKGMGINRRGLTADAAYKARRNGP